MRVQVVSFHCVLKNSLGQIISSSFNQDVVTTPAEGEFHQYLPGLVAVLKKLKSGEKREFHLNADEAYGFYDPDLVFTLPRSKFPNPEIAVGDFIQVAVGDPGHPLSCQVLQCDEKSVTLDGNHPLAGQDLIFNVEMVSSRMENDPSYDSEFEKRRASMC